MAQVARGVLLAALLGPSHLGTITAIAMVLAYAQWADVGAGLAVTRQIPLAIGAGQPDRAKDWAWYGLSLKLLASAAVSIALVAYVVIRGSALASDIRFGLLTAAIVVVCQAGFSSEIYALQACRRFAQAALLGNSLSICSLVFGVAGAVAAGLRGVFVAQVATYAIAAALGTYFLRPRRPRPIRMASVGTMFRVGLPLAALSFAGYNLVYVDQLVILRLLDSTQLGIYSIVLFAGSFLGMFPSAVAGAVSPRLIARWGGAQLPEAISALTWLPVRVLVLLLPPAVGVVWILAPLAIGWLLPDFEAAIGPMRIYLVGTYFLGVNLGVSSTLIAMNKHVWNVPILVCCIGLNIAVDLLLVRTLGLGLTGVAIGSAVTYAAYWLVHTAAVRFFMGEEWHQALRGLLASGWPGLLLAALAAFQWTRGGLGAPWTLSELVVAIALAAYLVGSLRGEGARVILTTLRKRKTP